MWPENGRSGTPLSPNNLLKNFAPSIIERCNCGLFRNANRAVLLLDAIERVFTRARLFDRTRGNDSEAGNRCNDFRPARSH